MSAPAASSELERAIDPWLTHMRWRRDFARWRERRINQEAYQSERLARLEQIAGRLDGLRVLDLGAGMGGFAVAAALRGARVVACEYNLAYCWITTLRAERHCLSLPVINAAGEALPLPDSAFDAVVCWDVIEHVQSPDEVLNEIARVLRPGGVALMTVINRRAWIDPHYHMRGINWLPRSWAEWLIARRGRAKQGAAFRDMQRLSDMHYFEYHAFVALAARHGFNVRDLREDDLLRGTLYSPKPVRRIVRAALRRLGLERAAYRLQRDWYTSMFELGLIRQ
ncbi:MAG: class I SAM-dependent methyltransferase [Roseiflexaceae bacterium]|nr:class I SAM-dependent methyltransferase [Roseiflexus sp.]MDW8144804.1 class I SAM-dependent methyltransferase [Roseiflexaceae bacterium]MDW8213503.1 class I SAM-dependent methyltransferase [Roseiflexaceae bacterium]